MKVGSLVVFSVGNIHEAYNGIHGWLISPASRSYNKKSIIDMDQVGTVLEIEEFFIRVLVREGPKWISKVNLEEIEAEVA
jgi:hypothetical protein